VELVLQKLQLDEILDKEIVWLQALRSEHSGRDKKYKPEPVSDIGCVNYEHYCVRHKTIGEAEMKLVGIAPQSQFETYEGTVNTSGASGSGIEALESCTVTDSARKPSALPEKLNSALNNIRKIRDRNTCEVVEHQREVTKRKSDVKNKKRKRKSWITSGSNEVAAVENDTGADDLKKESRMKEIMKQEIHGVKIPNIEHDPLSMKTSDAAQANEKLEQLDSLKQKLLLMKEHNQKTADNMQACTTVAEVMDKALCNMQTTPSSKVSPSTLQKLQQFKRTSSYTDSMSRNMPEDQKSLISVGQILNSKKDTNTDRVNMQFETFNDLVNYGKKLSSSHQSSNSSFSNNNGLTSLDRSLSKLPQNSTQVFSTVSDDFEDLDFNI
jgi:hypothetical protein